MSDTSRDFERASDEELVRWVHSGESPHAQSAAAHLLGRYRKAVYVWCFRYVGDRDRALDMAQDVLLRAYEGLPSFLGKSKFSSWLFAITRNRCLNAVRRVDLLSDAEADWEGIPSGDPGPDRELDDREEEEHVLGVIRRVLDPLEQKVVWMRCFERLPVDEITRVLAIETASGARGILQRARRKLRKAMTRE